MPGCPAPEWPAGMHGVLTVPDHVLGRIPLLDWFCSESVVAILPKGAELLLGVNAEGVPPVYRNRTRCLKVGDLSDRVRLGLAYVPVILQEPLGLRLRWAGSPELCGCRCCVPALEGEAVSINHAYTLISEAFEPSRRSHTGNVFVVGCYEGFRGMYHPLDRLRKRHEVLRDDLIQFLLLYRAAADRAQLMQRGYGPGGFGGDKQIIELFSSEGNKVVDAVRPLTDEFGDLARLLREARRDGEILPGKVERAATRLGQRS